MSEQINLLKTEKKVQQKTSMFFNICLAILLIVAIVSVGEVLYRFYLNSRINEVDLEQQQTSERIKRIDAKRVKFETLKERLNAIDKVYPSIKKFSFRLNGLIEKVPGDISIEGITVSNPDIEYKLYSENLSTLNTFLTTDLLELSKSKELGISNITISTVGINPNPAGYTATIKYKFK